MKTYRKLLDEITLPSGQKTGSPERRALLSPQALTHPGELQKLVPLKKHFIGPSPWYTVIEKLTPVQEN